MTDAQPIIEQAEYNPRFGPGDTAADPGGAEIVIEDVMVSIRDGKVYYEVTNKDSRGQHTKEAELIDQDFELIETA